MNETEPEYLSTYLQRLGYGAPLLQSDFGIRMPQHPDLRDIVARLIADP